MAKNNLIFVSPSAEFYGAEKMLISLIKGLEQSEIFSTVLLPAAGPFSKQLREMSIEHYFLGGIAWYRRHPLYLLPGAWRIAKVAIKKKAKAIVSNIYTSNKHCVIASKISGSKSICIVLAAMNKKEFSYHLLSYADLLIPNCDSFLQDCRALARPQQKIVKIDNAIDTEFYCPGKYDKSFIKSLGISDKEFVVGVVAAVCEMKGQHVMIKALPRILKENSNIRVLIVGGPRGKNADYIYQLHKMAWELGVSNKVTFTGPLDDVRGVFGGLDVMVLPTLTEGAPYVLKEAMAMKVPVVASAVGGVPEVIKEETTGLLVPPEDPDALADAILKLMKDKHLREVLSVNGRRWIQEKYSIKDYIKKSTELFQEVCRE